MILAGVKARAAVVLDGVGRGEPEESVEGIARKLHADRSIGYIFGSAGHEAQAFIEALRLGPHLRCLAKVPLAKMDRVIAARLQHFGNRHLVARHAHFIHRRHLTLSLGMINRRVQPSLRRVMREIFRQLFGNGDEFEAEPGRITPGHQRRTRR